MDAVASILIVPHVQNFHSRGVEARPVQNVEYIVDDESGAENVKLLS